MTTVASKFIWLFILLIVNSSWVNAQNYFEYYQNVSNAETAIVEAKYDSALYHYQKAFNSVTNPIANDLYNAAICASYTGNNTIGIQYAEKILRKGMNFSIFNHKAFKGLKNDKAWKDIKKNRKTIVSEARKSWDVELRKKIELICNDDQYFRKKSGSYQVYGDTIRKIDSLNFERIKGIISEYGYPNENNLGFEKPWHIFHLNFYIPVRHYYQNKGCLLSDVLYKEVENGHMLPQIFSELEDKKNNYLFGDDKFGTIVFFRINGEVKENKKTEEQIYTYNKNRKLIGLDSYENYKKKIIYIQNKNPFHLGCAEGMVTLITR